MDSILQSLAGLKNEIPDDKWLSLLQKNESVNAIVKGTKDEYTAFTSEQAKNNSDFLKTHFRIIVKFEEQMKAVQKVKLQKTKFGFQNKIKS